jgi:hypothetical protein
VGSASSDFDRAREKWQEADASHYRYNLNLSCFCAFNENMPLVIEVQDGDVVSMEYQNGNEIEEVNLEQFQKYDTIDDIFAELEKALNGEADKVTVSYDETYGFPTQIDIDFIEEAIDDELYLTVSDFEVLP